MRHRLSLFAVLLILAVPLSASQFVELPFDQLARGSYAVVRATVGPVVSSWDAEREVIYSRAPLQVHQYMAGFGPEVLSLREVGGTVGDYTQMAIGFPALREGEEVVLFLSRWEDSGDMRIEGYSHGKYLVRENIAGQRVLVRDPFTQGHRPEQRRLAPNAVGSSASDGIALEDFQKRLDAVWTGNVEARFSQQ